MENKEKAEKEAKEKMRQYAMKNIGSQNLLNLAIAYLVHKDKGYGENDNASVDEFLYQPALNGGPNAYDLESGEQANLLTDGLLGSRKDGERYTGSVSEIDMIKTAASIVQSSLASLKVRDMAQILGYDPEKMKKEYGEVYISDLLQSKSKEAQNRGKTLIGLYSSYMSAMGVSKAVGMKGGQIRGGLEKLLMQEEKKK